MPKPPEPNSKNESITVFAKNLGHRDQIKAFKQICNRDRLHVSTLFFEFITRFLKEHNWEVNGGNPQISLDPVPARGQVERLALIEYVLQQIPREKINVDLLYGKLAPHLGSVDKSGFMKLLDILRSARKIRFDMYRVVYLGELHPAKAEAKPDPPTSFMTAEEKAILSAKPAAEEDRARVNWGGKAG